MLLQTRREFLAGAFATLAKPVPRPNILFLISDDQSWLHAGISGERALSTPAFDEVAGQGILFTHCFCSSPSCAPSRAAILTGQQFWRLEEGANMRAHLPAGFATYSAVLEKAGYHVGSQGKGYGPTDPRERAENPAGRKYSSFGEFLKQKSPDRPFCFWFGSTHPHRPYTPGGWRKLGRWTLANARVPPYLPDTPEVRSDLLDYYVAIEDFDRESREILSVLDRSGQRDNTLVVMTSDNGMSFPRGKCNLYDWGTRMPMAVRWPAVVANKGRRVDDFISQTDLAPTFLEAAGLESAPAMTGRSFMNVLTSPRSGEVDPARSRVFTGRERHSVSREHAEGYPCRALRTRDFLYIRNFKPERWPAGDPPGSADVDPSPTRDLMVRNRKRHDITRYFHLAFDRRPEQELYDLREDPHQLNNVADSPRYQSARKKISAELTAYLRKTGDPRITGNGDIFDQYPFWGSGEHK